MANIPLRFATFSVNGRPEAQVFSTTNVPYGSGETNFQGFIDAIKAGLQYDINNIQNAINSGRVDRNSYTMGIIADAQAKLSALNSGDYSPLTRYGVTPDQINQLKAGSQVASGMVDRYVHPLTGEVLTNVPQAEIDKMEAQAAGVKNGTLQDIGGGKTIPVGSAGANLYNDYISKGLGYNSNPPSNGSPVSETLASGQGNNGQPGAVSGATGGSSGTIGGVDISGLPPEMQALLSTLQGQLDELKKRGQIVNPNVEITPEKMAEFANLAAGQIDPYFQTQLKVATDEFLKSLGYTQKTIADTEARAEETYGRSLRTVGENAAEQGMALSGARQQQEAQLATTTQQALDDARRQASYQAENTARQYAQTWAGLPGYTAPNINLTGASRVLPGQAKFEKNAAETPFYSLSPELYSNLIGTQQNSRQNALKNLQSELATNYTTQEANKQLRQLTL